MAATASAVPGAIYRDALENEKLFTSYGKGRSIIEAAIRGEVSIDELYRFSEGELVEAIARVLVEHDPLVYGRRSTFIPKASRSMVYERDGYRCKACGATENLSLDHIIPVSKGGSDDPQNLQTLCRRCNSVKHKRELSLEKLRKALGQGPKSQNGQLARRP